MKQAGKGPRSKGNASSAEKDPQKGPVFIVGLHRTGSTMLGNMLGKNSMVAMAPDEMHIWSPYPWRKTFADATSGKDPAQERDIDTVLDKMFSGALYGTCWKLLGDMGIEKNDLKGRFLSLEDPQWHMMIQIISDMFLEHTGKQRFGVKYPIHFSKIHLLNEWFPACRTIHLTRDPRAIYMSKKKDEASTRRKGRLGSLRFLVDLYTMAFNIVEYRWSARVHRDRSKNEGYLLVRYEDLLSDPVVELSRLCGFLDLPLEDVMFEATGKPSSYDGSVSAKVDRARAERWKKEIGRFEQRVMRATLKGPMGVLGYSAAAKGGD